MRCTKKGLVKLGLYCLSALLIVSCSDNKPKSEVKSDKVIKASTEIPQIAASQEVSVKPNDNADKFNQYIDFYNEGLIGLSNELNNYFKKEGKAETLKKDGDYTSGSKYKNWEQIKTLIKEPPAFQQLDKAAAELIPAAEQLDELLATAREYYKAKKYTADNYAQGQELHTKILATSQKYQQAYSQFEVAIKAKESETRSLEMEQAKKEGNELVYNRILVSILMDKILTELETQKVSARNVTTTDLTKIKPLYEDLSLAQKALREASKVRKAPKNKDLINEHYSKEFVDTTAKFKACVVDLIERVETQKPLNEAELRVINATPAKGTPELLIELRKETIKEYNNSI